MTIGTPASLGTANNSTGSTATMAAGANLAPGETAIVFVQLPNQSSVTVSSLTVGGNAASFAIREQAATNLVSYEVWYYYNNTGSTLTAPTITANLSGSATTPGISALKCSGLSATPLDKAVGATGSSNTPSSGSSGTLSQAAELALSCVYLRSAWTATPVAGFTNIINLTDTQGEQSYVDYQIVNSTSALTANPSSSASAAWCAIIVTFKASPVNYGFNIPMQGM